MRADEYGIAGGGPAGVATGEQEAPGRIDVKDRVLVKVTQEASASMIGVSRGDVSVDVSSYRDGLIVRLATPLPVPDLEDLDAVRASPPILERAARLQEDLRDRLSQLLGREIVKINLTITGATIPERKRVR
ncbi:hypothetical protein [Microbacterium sp.]|uniref:hypothetical protein n=1 Tax=Microbacterium sp. TaxID=51671 RepID=UPI003F6F92FA